LGRLFEVLPAAAPPSARPIAPAARARATLRSVFIRGECRCGGL